VYIQLAENLGRIQQVLVVVDPIVPEKISSDQSFVAGIGNAEAGIGEGWAGRTSSH
jgi:hypothetical protein